MGKKYSQEDLEKLKECSIIDYLSKKGYSPEKISSRRGGVYTYNVDGSKSGALDVNIVLNRFTKWNSEEKGSIIDLVMLMENKSYFESLEFISNQINLIKTTKANKNVIQKVNQTIPFQILSSLSQNKHHLNSYLMYRGISLEAFKKSSCEYVFYKKKDIAYSFSGIGIKNEKNGYTINKRYFSKEKKAYVKRKEVLGNNAISLDVRNPSSSNLLVVEGIFEYLSLLELGIVANIVTLNSINNYRGLINLVKSPKSTLHQKINHSKKINVFTLLNNDKNAQLITNKIKQEINSTPIVLTGKEMDINDLLLENKESLKKTIIKKLNINQKPINHGNQIKKN